jgi:hypothetical protein
VTFDVPLGLFAPRLGEKALNLGYPELRPTLGRALLILQSYGPFAGDPQVDNFRHLNGQRYPDACWGIGTDPPIRVNYADTVTVDHWPSPSAAISEASSLATRVLTSGH